MDCERVNDAALVGAARRFDPRVIDINSMEEEGSRHSALWIGIAIHNVRMNLNNMKRSLDIQKSTRLKCRVPIEARNGNRL